jgi:MFS family permease
MSLETPDRTTASRTHTITPAEREPATSAGWWGDLGDKGRKAFKAAFAGYSLDAFDLIILTLTLAAIGTTFDVGTGATGALATVTLSASAVGGILGGVLSDRIGRAKTLMLTVGVYSLFTFLSASSRASASAASGPSARSSWPS